MHEWHRQIQHVVDRIDECIMCREDEGLALRALSRELGYSEYHTTRKFKQIAGVQLKQYLRLRRLAFALVEVRDTGRRFLDIAVDYGFSSHEAFARAFKSAYGITPGEYRRSPVPVVLRTKINPFNRYFFGIGEIGMLHSTEEIKIYFVTIPAFKFLHIKNYQSNGYWDFWAKQDMIPGQDCDTICGLLDSVTGKLDGRDNVIGSFSGQIMGTLFEADGSSPEAYGVRLPQAYKGVIPKPMLMTDVPEGEYIVFEHGPFDYEQENDTVYEKLSRAVADFSFDGSGYRLDESVGRMAFGYHVPESYMKTIRPVRKK